VNKSLPELVEVFVSDEVDSVLTDIEIARRSAIENQERVIERIVERSAPAPVFTMPAITVNVPAQEARAKDDEMNIIINNPASVTLESDKQAMAMKAMTDNIEKVSKALDANTSAQPVINVQVNPTPVTVQNDVQVDVPKQETPNVTVNVDPTPVTVHAPVTVDNPVTVNVPRIKKETQVIRRDSMGNIAQTETDVEYED